MPKRNRKRFTRPKKIFDSATIKSENNLIKKYGLKNRREVWKADFAIMRIREIAKELITANEEKKIEFVKRQKEKGFNVETIADVLALNKEDYLKRRLQSIVAKKGFSVNPKQARQLIVHKHVMLDGKYINSPAHLTTLNEENSITCDLNLKGLDKKEITEEEKRFLKKIKETEKQSSEREREKE